MRNFAPLTKYGVFCATLWALAGTVVPLFAQSSSDAAAASVVKTDQLNQADLLKAYLNLQEQLRVTQLTVVNNRIEAEATARAQAAQITDKLDALKAAMTSERERSQAELQRAATERERVQMEAQRSAAELELRQAEMQSANHTAWWILGSLGTAGFVALVVTGLFQWRAIRRVTELGVSHPQLPAPSRSALLSLDSRTPGDETVATSNHRLLSVIERMEQRIFELEHTMAHPATPAAMSTSSTPAPTGNGTMLPPAASSTAANGNGTPPVRAEVREASTNGAKAKVEPEIPPAASNSTTMDNAMWFSVLINKGRMMIRSGRPKDAISCYDEILRWDPKHAEAWVRKGAALERLKHDDEALRCYNRAIEADGKMTLAYLHKGGVCSRLNMHAESVECYELALQAEEQGGSAVPRSVT